MIFFLLHHVVHTIPGNFSDQTRNLITFLVGIMLYTFLWSYVNTSKSKNFAITSIRYGFYYIFVSDCFAMGIVYKNYYNRSITTEVSSAWGSNVPVANTKVSSEDYINPPMPSTSVPSASIHTSKPVFANNFTNKPSIIEETTEEIISETPVNLLQEINTELEDNDDVEDIDSTENNEKIEEVEEIEEVDEIISLPVKNLKKI